MRGLLLKELAEHKSLLLESPGTFIMREQVRHFVAEDGYAARFQSDDGRTRVDFRLRASNI